MEDSLKYLAGRLTIPYAPSWESYIKPITEQIALKHAHKTVDWKRDEAFFREILGDLVAVKTAWRNPLCMSLGTTTLTKPKTFFAPLRLSCVGLPKMSRASHRRRRHKQS
jgi:hypothetical protein